MTDSPIGIFDSGFGGLTVAREVLDQLPNESVLYLGDTARAPYGPQPIADVRANALQCLDRLVEHGVKALVIACNSASAAVLADARERYDVPVVEVIRPAVRRAMSVTRSGRVAVISTLATHQSRAYLDAFAAAPPHVEVLSQPCPRFVEFVEDGITSGPEVIGAAREYLAPLQEADIDTLILGCTHYPLLSSALSYVLGDRVSLVSSAAATAADLFRVLTDTQLLRPSTQGAPTHQFLTTGDPHGFTPLARRFLGPEVEHVARAYVGRPEEAEMSGERP
ncbi:MAG: glutamate racemase [Ornithinimicrobium sp.]